MATYYFVGGPLPGRMEEFRGRLAAAGGVPEGWTILPHASGDGRALHVVTAASVEAIRRHLAAFEGIYGCGEIVEVKAPPRA